MLVDEEVDEYLYGCLRSDLIGTLFLMEKLVPTGLEVKVLLIIRVVVDSEFSENTRFK